MNGASRVFRAICNNLARSTRIAAASSATVVEVGAVAEAAASSSRSKLPTWAKFSSAFAAASFMTVAQSASVACAPAAAAATGAATKASSGGKPAQTHDSYKVVFVLGGPGSGKGTQSARLVEEFGLVHLSAGDLLRAHMKSGSPEGQMVADMIALGQIVPSSVTNGLLLEAMEKSGKDKFLIDGFPRNEENRTAFEEQTGLQPALVLFFDCPDEVMERRLLGRNEGRTDDNIETIRKRFHVFLSSSMPVIEHYEAQGKVARILADRAPDEIYKEVRSLFLEF